jgi:hypothetical protein
LTSRPSTDQILDATCDNYINDFYRFDFPKKTGISNFQTDFTQDTAVSDSGEYSISEEVIAIERPVTIDGEIIDLYTDKERFFRKYPENEHYKSPPTLAIGSSSTSAVANSAFTYGITGWAYSKAAAETELSGDTVPQNKYGAWVLSIDTDSTITVTEADDNATGYDTPGLAVNGLPDLGSGEAVMGFVTAINTSGTFIPGTTALSASGVTDTYTDGRYDIRGEPEAALVEGGKLFLRKKADDIYRFEAQMTLQRPSALSDDSDEPLDTSWGLAIALGAAIKCMANEEFDEDKILKLKGDPRNPLPGTLEYEINLIKSKRYIQWSRAGRTAPPAF